MTPVNENRLSYWYPKLVAAGLGPSMPRTELVRVPDECDLDLLLDGREPEGFADFVGTLQLAARKFETSYCFLRHDLFSAKHSYSRTCKVERSEDMAAHVGAILEDWAITDFLGLQGGTDVWAVRAFIPPTPIAFTAHMFGDLPIGPERRYIVEDGKVTDAFPYWPLRAFEQESVDQKTLEMALATVSASDAVERRILGNLAWAAGTALGGAWSIDFMHTQWGWLLIDCARKEDSWIPEDQDREDWSRILRQS